VRLSFGKLQILAQEGKYFSADEVETVACQQSWRLP
jgi:hypothetical protein